MFPVPDIFGVVFIVIVALLFKGIGKVGSRGSRKDLQMPDDWSERLVNMRQDDYERVKAERKKYGDNRYY